MDEIRPGCPDEMKTQLSRYVDGELSPEETSRVDAHVGACASCRELLDLFRRNESLLQGALTTDAFGDAVVASVVRSLRQEGPPVADPVEEGLGEWLRARPLVPLGAAAAFILGLVLLLNASHGSRLGELRRELGSVREESRKAAEEHRSLLRLTAANNQQVERALRDQRSGEVLAGARRANIAYFDIDRGVVVKAGFEGRRFDAYEAWRQGPDDQAFEKISREPLAQPEFVDRGAKPGRVYLYKLRGVSAGGESADSAPVRIQVPAPASAEQSLRVHCFDLAVTRDLGIFLLERKVDGRTHMEKFVVNLGDRIGGPVEVAGVGRIDFSTGLVLSRIEEGQQTLPLSYAEPVLDAEGRPVVERVENGRPVYLTRQHDVPVSIRPNLRAVCKPAAGGPGEESVFKGSWLAVRAE